MATHPISLGFSRMMSAVGECLRVGLGGLVDLGGAVLGETVLGETVLEPGAGGLVPERKRERGASDDRGSKHCPKKTTTKEHLHTVATWRTAEDKHMLKNYVEGNL